MMLAYIELQEHEDYCGSRTELCVTCSRYVMVRDAEIHRETNCEYPAVEQKNESESSTADAAGRFNWMGDEHDFPHPFSRLFGPGMFGMHNDFPEHVREMLENHQSDRSGLENVFRRMGYYDASSGVSRPGYPFTGHRLRPFLDDPPPPYINHNNADDTHADDSHVTRERQNMPVDHISVSSDDDDDGMSSLCFLKSQILKNMLMRYVRMHVHWCTTFCVVYFFSFYSASCFITLYHSFMLNIK